MNKKNNRVLLRQQHSAIQPKLNYEKFKFTCYHKHN